MKRFKKSMSGEIEKAAANRYDAINTGESLDCRWGLNPSKLLSLLVLTLILFSVYVMLRDPPSDLSTGAADDAKRIDFDARKGIKEKDDILRHSQAPKDNVLSNLLPTGFDEKSCISRYQSLLYRKDTERKASPYLISKLRNYEAMHKRCGPHTESYNRAVRDLRSASFSSTSDCRYIVWISFSGLGNRILTLGSTFLYALLTERILLVDRGTDMNDLFCEPFPETSWLLPHTFPLTNKFNDFNQKSNMSYGNLIRSNLTLPDQKPYVYLHLVHDYHDEDKLFFCDQDQQHLQNVPWLIMKTDNYFIPFLFLIPSFERELHNLFPDKETVFHLLGRYLFHPTNSVWGLISRYYQAYLSHADLKVGIQIRVFGTGPFKHVVDQTLACIKNMSILPQIGVNKTIMNPSEKQKSIAVLITSLNSVYFEEIKNLYWENPTATGDVIAVYQPSHEEYQQSDNQNHNRKAWAEMYLLSLMDKLVTSSWSTFGYVGQSLGGLKPWILYKTDNNGSAPNPACCRAESMEPCFHAPPYYDCKMKRGIDTGHIVPHVRHCEDMSWGLKLVDKYK